MEVGMGARESERMGVRESKTDRAATPEFPGHQQATHSKKQTPEPKSSARWEDRHTDRQTDRQSEKDLHNGSWVH